MHQQDDEKELSNDDQTESPIAPVTDEQLFELAESQGLVTHELGTEELETETDVPALTPQEEANITASIETILFMSDRPVSLPKLRSVLNPEVPLSVFRKLMTALKERYQSDSHGIEIAEVSLGFQFRTKPQMSQVLRKLVKTQPLKLSPTTLEVLAICAYKQPITKDEMDQIRGVDSGYVLRNLMEKRLVRITGRSDLPGRPMLYGTTHEFLELFCLKDTKGLPALHEVEAMVAASEVGMQEQQEKAFEEFSKIVDNNQRVLFEDPQSEAELEELRAEIARIPTSTSFLDEEKAAAKRAAKIEALTQEIAQLEVEGRLEEVAVLKAELEELTRPAEELLGITTATELEVAQETQQAAESTETATIEEGLAVTPPAETTTVDYDDAAALIREIANTPEREPEPEAGL